MAHKVVVNGEEVVPSTKVKLDKHMSATEIKKLITDKRKELDEQP